MITDIILIAAALILALAAMKLIAIKMDTIDTNIKRCLVDHDEYDMIVRRLLNDMDDAKAELVKANARIEMMNSKNNEKHDEETR